MKSWYIIAYDIREPKRLRRLHYFLKKKAIALQNSVFLVKADAHYLKHLESSLEKLINIRDNDVRIYPVLHPDTLWAAGKQASAFQHLYAGKKKQSRKRKRPKWVSSLFGWLS